MEEVGKERRKMSKEEGRKRMRGKTEVGKYNGGKGSERRKELCMENRGERERKGVA